MLPPHLSPLTDADLEVLDSLRLERFRSRMGQILHGANLYISGLDRTLIISGGRETGALRYRQIDLLQQSWQVCACTWVKVYASNELILNLCSSYNGLGEESRGESMAAAIQEQEEVMLAAEDSELAVDGAPQHALPGAKIIRSMALTDIAADLEAEPSALQAFLEERSCTLIDFSGTILVPENEAVVAYEHYSLVRARQKMEERFAALNTPISVEKPIAREAKPKKNYLTWKGSFKVNRSSYKKTIESAINALFPNEPDEQQKALADIVEQTDMGKAIVDKIARDPAYTDKTRAREQLLKAATELAADQNNSEKEEEEATV